MFYWSQVPFIRITLLFVAGILVFNSCMGEENTILLFILILSGLLVSFVLLKKSNKLLRQQRIQGLLLNFLIFFLGVLISYLNQNEINTSLQYSHKEKIWIGEVHSIEQTESNYLKCVINIESSIESDAVNYIHPKLKILSFLEKNNESKDLIVGDLLYFSSVLSPLKEPLNPVEFNQKEYFKNKGIYSITFLNSYQKIGQRNSLNNYFTRLNSFLKESFLKSGIDKKELQTLNAIFLGNKKELDPELKDAFKNAGAMHILAVSGLHVGIVYLILNSFLNSIPFFRRKKKFKVFFLLFFLWLYAGLSGFSPSVQRAALMFSLFAIGQGLNRKPSIYNTIAVSAFLLLLVNPNFIYDLSFQLSYSAVVGIVSIYPILSKIASPKNKFTKYFYDILLVSIAAQLATLPITIYYFHQFPNWFLLTNLFAIPLAFISVGLSAIISILYFLFNSDLYFGLLLDFSLKALNTIVETIDQLPFSIIQNIWIEPISALLLLTALTLVVIHFYYYSIRLVLGSLFILVCVLSIEIYISANYATSDEFTVYAFKDKLVTSLRLKNYAKVFSTDSLTNYENKIVKDHLLSMEVIHDDFILISENIKDDSFFVEGGLAFTQFKEKLVCFDLGKDKSELWRKLEVDFLLDLKPNFDEAYLNSKVVITPLINKPIQTVKSSQFYSLRKEGAFRLNL